MIFPLTSSLTKRIAVQERIRVYFANFVSSRCYNNNSHVCYNSSYLMTPVSVKVYQWPQNAYLWLWSEKRFNRKATESHSQIMISKPTSCSYGVQKAGLVNKQIIRFLTIRLVRKLVGSSITCKQALISSTSARAFPRSRKNKRPWATQAWEVSMWSSTVNLSPDRQIVSFRGQRNTRPAALKMRACTQASSSTMKNLIR